MDTMLLGFEEINSTINKYLDYLESDEDEELAPRQSNKPTDVKKLSPISKTNNVHNSGIQSMTLNPKGVTLFKELDGIYNTGATSGVGALKDAKYFISTEKNSNIVLSFPTATPCRKLK